MEKANLGYMVETHPVPAQSMGPLLGASYLLCWSKPRGTRT
jgi:ureidoglycolate hydrolase